MAIPNPFKVQLQQHRPFEIGTLKKLILVI
jgi:hypothetical protein